MVDVKCISFSGYVSVDHKGLGLDVHKCGSLTAFCFSVWFADTANTCHRKQVYGVAYVVHHVHYLSNLLKGDTIVFS